MFSPNISQEAFPNSWVTAIAPYDRGHILEAFEAGESLPNGGDNGAHDSNADLFEKTFDRVLRVAPLLGSDWARFLTGLLKEMLGPWSSDESGNEQTRRNLVRLLEIHLHKRDRQPTPRRIITYVNEIGTLWLQSDPEIPMESVALYVLHKNDVESAPSSILQRDFIKREFRNYLVEGETIGSVCSPCGFLQSPSI